MIIELFGLPASGKTTIARRLAEGNDFVRVKIESRSEWFLYNLFFLVKHPVKFYRGLFFIIKFSENFQNFYLKFMNCFIIHNAKHQKAKRFKLAIIDQGYFQNVLSVPSRPLSNQELNSCVKNFLPPDLLVVFDLSFEEREARLAGRGQVARPGFEATKIKTWQEASEINYQLLKKELPRLGLPFLFLEANLETSVLVDKIEKCLELLK